MTTPPLPDEFDAGVERELVDGHCGVVSAAARACGIESPVPANQRSNWGLLGGAGRDGVDNRSAVETDYLLGLGRKLSPDSIGMTSLVPTSAATSTSCG